MFYFSLGANGMLVIRLIILIHQEQIKPPAKETQFSKSSATVKSFLQYIQTSGTVLFIEYIPNVMHAAVLSE